LYNGTPEIRYRCTTVATARRFVIPTESIDFSGLFPRSAITRLYHTDTRP
jgi:hypothetical protein